MTLPTLATSLDEIKRRNQSLNAIVEYCENINIGGHFQAKMPESALSNWTFVIKSNIAVLGLAHTAGIGAFADRMAKEDAFVVVALRIAGAVIVGTVNMEEAALGAITNNPHFGKTHNPHRHGYTSGGSSGGSGAAVAAGLARVALGTDTMGSCRIPAAYCGVVGFKPSYGRLSCHGVEPLSRRLDHVGILARTVADVNATFSVLDQFNSLDADARAYAYVNQPVTVPSALTLAVLDDAAINGLSAEVRQAYETALGKLRKAGYRLQTRAVDQVTLARARRAGLLVCEAALSNSLAEAMSAGASGISTSLRALIEYGAKQSAPKLAAAHAQIDDAQLILRAQLHDIDAICWPTAPQTAFSFDAAIPANQADFTCLANFTGAPAISVPIPVAPNGLPVGLQLMMHLGSDTQLLAAAQAIESILNTNN